MFSHVTLVMLAFSADPYVELSGSRPSDTPGAYEAETVNQLRMTLNGDEFAGDAIGYAQKGVKLFPLYLELLEDMSSEFIHVERVYGIISVVEADRSRFYSVTVERLADKNPSIRTAAIRFLALVGSEKDTAPLAALLYDSEMTVRNAAATTIVAIGSKHNLQVFDLARRHVERYLDRDSKPLLYKYDGEHFDECRAKLEARLKKQEREAAEKKAEPKK